VGVSGANECTGHQSVRAFYCFFLWIFQLLDSLFSLAPWVFMFLVPAITMRMISEEKRSGTLELLFTRPLNEFQIVMAKFLAAWTLVIISILPTLIFYLSVYLLGSPVGNIDTGGTWGSYIGLVFLGGIYAAIGLFASSMTENQIASFIIAVLFVFLFYMGFGFLASLGKTGVTSLFIEKFGIDFHYQSISRGVVDSRDLLYFLSTIFLFLYFTKTILVTRKW
jgi:ABC-2 type transport system permease protein